MTKNQKQIIKEVIYSIDLHQSIIRNNLKHNAKIDRYTLDYINEGMKISISKLENLISA